LSLGSSIAPPPAFASFALTAKPFAPAPKPQPAVAAATESRQIAVAAAAPAPAKVSIPPAPWPAPAANSQQASVRTLPAAVQQPSRPEVVVDYSVLASYAPTTYAAPPTSPVRQLGQVTIDYSVLN
jgi:hypothetical protein